MRIDEIEAILNERMLSSDGFIDRPNVCKKCFFLGPVAERLGKAIKNASICVYGPVGKEGVFFFRLMDENKLNSIEHIEWKTVKLELLSESFLNEFLDSEMKKLKNILINERKNLISDIIV